ncbi:MAG: hypothetical protein UY72_C0061G0004 [Candidatus Uhrbacteria bacterium GW2011_GWD2_52_7]|uniref:Uncharacterized protein n=1 Tax=Candidatus Uhrbacteria bacterium GW2011_GWD2_52_7 TaxID=1618989 RepID=A0A0G2A8Z4_9BACT|nr:MAG: hypothetical protein UY72_C0061G0004 [Candidatus Uhrbacteria bacterium GW2011_GWD2_52_7]
MRMLKHLVIGATLLALPLGFARLPVAHAATLDDATENMGLVRQETGLEDADLTETIGKLIGVLLSFLGVIFLLLIIYAGFLWMTARGDSKAVDKAKDILTTSVVGLVILLSAYAISSFVIESLQDAVTG